ncbi:MAG TPA: hypothetical protein VFP49_02230 [Nitrososphaeraceae archaeon]|nr:hypothetical protein [Nitrososphaeraceae archaeon]
MDSKTTLVILNEILRELKYLAIDDKKTLLEIVIDILSDYMKKKK